VHSGYGPPDSASVIPPPERPICGGVRATEQGVQSRRRGRSHRGPCVTTRLVLTTPFLSPTVRRARELRHSSHGGDLCGFVQD
jgi:hypothetical protein